MKRICLIIALLSLAGMACAQTSCFVNAYEKGKSAFAQGKYTEAKKYYNAAKQCPDCPKRSDIDERIKSCEREIAGQNRQSQNGGTPKTSAKEPSIAIKDISVSRECHDDRMCAEITATIIATKMRGKTIRADCYIWPFWQNVTIAGDERILSTLSDEQYELIAAGANYEVTSKYRGSEFDIPYRGSKLDISGWYQVGLQGEVKYIERVGQQGEVIYIEKDYQQIKVVYNIPYGAMELYNYDLQRFGVTIEANEMGGWEIEGTKDTVFFLHASKDIEIVATKDTVFDFAPINLKVLRDVVDFASEGGEEDLHLSVCGSIECKDIPSWLKIEGGQLYAEANTTTSDRHAEITIQAVDGTNPIKVSVNQKGRLEPIVINSVRLLPETLGGVTDNDRMQIHIDMTANNLRGRKVEVYAYFFDCEDELVLNEKGEPLFKKAYGTAHYDISHWDDFIISMSKEKLKAAYTAPYRKPNSNTSQKRLPSCEMKVYLKVSIDGGKTFLTTTGPYIWKWE